MLQGKFKIRKSLSLKVLLSSIGFAMLITTLIGLSVHNRVAATIINEKIAKSKPQDRLIWLRVISTLQDSEIMLA